MRITSGSGNNRNTFEFPCGAIVKRAAPEEQAAGLGVFSKLLGVGVSEDIDKPVWVVMFTDNEGVRQKYSAKPMTYVNAGRLLKAAEHQAKALKRNWIIPTLRVEIAV